MRELRKLVVEWLMLLSPKELKSHAPDAQTFSPVLDQVAWLMTMTKENCDQPLHILETRVEPALLLKQLKLFYKEDQPVAFISWRQRNAGVDSTRFENGLEMVVRYWKLNNGSKSVKRGFWRNA